MHTKNRLIPKVPKVLFDLELDVSSTTTSPRNPHLRFKVFISTGRAFPREADKTGYFATHGVSAKGILGRYRNKNGPVSRPHLQRKLNDSALFASTWSHNESIQRSLGVHSLHAFRKVAGNR